jgi:hypothetical protein
MSNYSQRRWTRRNTLRGAVLGFSLCVLGGCDLESLLEVDLPARLTEESLTEPNSVGLMVNSVIGQFECGYASFLYEESAWADTWDRIAGRHGNFEYQEAPGTGSCDTAPEGFNWYMPMQISRSIAFQTYENLTGWTNAQVPNRERLLATTAVYAAGALDIFGEHMCDTAVDGSPLMSQDDMLALAEEWATKALGHIATTGDFAIPQGATENIETLAYGLRARIRWARGPSHWNGALADALRVPEGYTAWITRETGPERRNKVYVAATQVGYGHVHGPFTHWEGPPNPVTGESWPAVIPFTGYLDLGILPDGRAISDDQYPIRTVDNPTAVEDTRVVTRVQPIAGPQPGPVPLKYLAEAEDMPWVSWDDIWLIRAEIEGGQAAIDRVNELRAARDLPLVSYANAGNADQILDMIIEERRRELWIEGRFWATKIRNTDRLWFPRRFGNTIFTGYPYSGGVTMALPTSEYDLNPNMDLTERGTGCDPDRRPVFP